MVESDEHIGKAFAALSNPVRRAIIERLAGGEASVGELAEPFDISLEAVSKHTRVLSQAGLIERTPGPGSSIRCRLRGEQLTEVQDWLTDVHNFWQQRLNQLAAYLDNLND